MAGVTVACHGTSDGSLISLKRKLLFIFSYSSLEGGKTIEAGGCWEMCAMGTIEERLELGVAWKTEGKYDEAIAEFNAILMDQPNHAEAHRQLGLVYGYIGMFDESLQELVTACQIDPTNVAMRNDLALTYSMLGMMEEAKAEFEAVLAIDPNNEKAKQNIIYF